MLAVLTSGLSVNKLIFFQICCHPLGERRSMFFEDMLMCMVMELDNEDVDELEIDHVSLDNLADHIVVSKL